MPKQIQENGLAWADITFQKSAIMRLIRGYTLEAGVRNLEREIANILRKIAREAVKEGHMPPLAVPDADGAGLRRAGLRGADRHPAVAQLRMTPSGRPRSSRRRPPRSRLP